MKVPSVKKYTTIATMDLTMKTARKSSRLAVKYGARASPFQSRRSDSAGNSSSNSRSSPSPPRRSPEDKRIKMLMQKSLKYKALLRKKNLPAEERARLQDVVDSIATLLNFFKRKLREGDLDQSVVPLSN